MYDEQDEIQNDEQEQEQTPTEQEEQTSPPKLKKDANGFTGSAPIRAMKKKFFEVVNGGE